MRGSRPLTAEETRDIRGLFYGKMAIRNLALFSLGATTGFRITELLSLTLADILDDNNQFKDRVAVSRKHMKGKRTSRSVYFNATTKKALNPWLEILKRRGFFHRNDFLFQSYSAKNKAISRQQAWKVLTAAYAVGGLTGKLGTHAMRKTFANNVYNYFLALVAKGEAVDAFRSTSKALGHADIKSTDQYLSFLTEDVDKAVGALEI